MRVCHRGMGISFCASHAPLLAGWRLRALSRQIYHACPLIFLINSIHIFAGIVAYHSPTSPLPIRLCITTPVHALSFFISISNSFTHADRSIRLWFFTSITTPLTPAMSPLSKCAPAILRSA